LLQLLRQVSWRELRQRWGRALLFVVAIALGVAMITAIGISNDTVLVHFGRGIERSAGKADLQITFGTGEAGFPEEILERVRTHPSVARAMALVRGALTLADGSGDTLELFGVDVLADGVLEFYETTVRERTREGVVILNDPHALFVTNDLAERRGLRLEEQIELQSPLGVHQYTIRGILEPQGLAGVYGGNVAVMDLPAAQRILGKRSGLFGGNVDQIDVALRDGVSVSAACKELEATLPPDFTVAQPWQRRQDYERTFSGLRATLTGVSTAALLAAIFIVYSTTGTLVTQRTPTMATLLSVGGSPRRLVRLVIVEAAVLGAVGAVLGVALGAGMAFFTVQDIAAGMSLNYSLKFEAGSPTFTPWKLLVLYPLLGTGTAVCGALLPARWLARLDLLELLRPETRERLVIGVSSRFLVALSAALLLMAITVLAAGVRAQSALGCTAGAVLSTVAAVILVLPLVRVVWARLGICLERFLGIDGRIALESLNRYVERRCRFVGDQDRGFAGDRHRDHRALQHAAGKFERILLRAFGGIRDPRCGEQLDCTIGRLRGGEAAMHDQRFGDLIANRHRRVQRRHRVLEDHADLGAAHVRAVDQLAAQNVVAAQAGAAARDAAGRHWNQSHDALHRHRFAAAGLADNRQRFAGFDGEAHAAHRVDGAAVGIEFDVQVPNVQQRLRHSRDLMRASSASRNPSPSRLNASTVTEMNAAGKISSCG